MPPPYWSIAWPGGQALARHILDHPQLVAGKRVFDFATGSGLVALAAKQAGAAAVLANDIDPLAIVATGLNAAANHLTLEVLHENRMGADLRGWDVVLAGDIFYEWPMADEALAWLRAVARDGVEVWFGDPGRSYVPREGVVEEGVYAVPTSTEVEDGALKTTRVCRLLPEE